MKNYVQRGDVLEVPAAAGAVVAGQVVVVGAHIAVANHAAANGQPYNATLSGVFEVPKSTGVAFVQGQPIMWDASANGFAAVGTPASGDVTNAGVTAFYAAASGDTVVRARFSGIPGTVTA